MHTMNYGQKGFSLIEVLFSVALLSLFITALAGAIFYGQSSTVMSGNRARAVYLAEEGLEGVRNIRDANFTNLSDGTFGLTQSANQWTLSGTQDTTDIYTRQIIISSVDSKTKKITSTVTWKENLQRNGTVSFDTYLTGWNITPSPTPTPTITPTPVPQSSYLVINTLGAVLASTFIDINGVTFSNIGPQSVTVDKITISWTNSARRIQDIQISGNIVWSSTGVGTPTGTQTSGTTLDIVNTTIPANTTVPVNRFRFNGLMLLNTFTITATMTDGSTKTVTGIGL